MNGFGEGGSVTEESEDARASDGTGCEIRLGLAIARLLRCLVRRSRLCSASIAPVALEMGFYSITWGPKTQTVETSELVIL